MSRPADNDPSAELPGTGGIATFGCFELDLESGELRRKGRPVSLAAQPASVLCLLVARSGRLVPRDAIQDHVWRDRVVEYDTGINACIRQIRQVLGDRSESPIFVETVPRKGYRFIAPVEWTDARAQGRVEVLAMSGRRRPRRSVVLAALAVLSSVALWLGWAHERGGRGDARTASESSDIEPASRLVVLPFESLSADPSPDADGRDGTYYAEGLSEDLITEIASLAPERLSVVARTSALRYRDSDKSVAEIGRELDVDYLLHGSVRREGEMFRVAVKLTRVADQAHVWARRFDRTRLQALDVQLEVAELIATSLLPQVSDRAPIERPKYQPEAHETWLVARHLLGRGDRTSSEQALSLLEQALELDPMMAPAYVTLAHALSRVPGTLERRKDAIARALELDPSLGEAHLQKGNAALYADWDFGVSETSFRRAVAVEPGLAEGHRSLAMYLALTGRFDEAVSELEIARSLDPVSAALMADGAMVYFLARRFEDVIAACERAIELDPSRAQLVGYLFDAQLSLGQSEQALLHARSLMQQRGASADELAALGNGSVGDRLAYFHGWNLESLERSGAPPVALAGALLHVGRIDDAFSMLDKAFDQRSPQLLFVPADPRAEPFREDPRYLRLTSRIGLNEFEWFRQSSRS